jgi:two-component system, LytTR family, response regulator
MLDIILIDDEADARQLLRGMLTEHTDCRIIGEADSFATASLLLQKTTPDVVFLDIDLTDGSGFDVLQSLPTIDFSIVFVTASNSFALKAFQVNALDYLLKPISPDDLHRALTKIRQNQSPKPDVQAQMQGLMSAMQHHKLEKLVLTTAKGVHFIPLDEIIYLKSEGNYTTVFTTKNEHIMVSQNLGTFDHLVTEGSVFFRTHQSYILNIKAVRQILKQEDGDFALLHDATKIPIARRKKEAFLSLMTRLS